MVGYPLAKDLSQIRISNQGKENFEKFPILWYFQEFFSEKIMTTKGTLITIIKENNHFLCESKPLKFH